MTTQRGDRKFVAVIGLGQFGTELARMLAGHCEVLAIDRNEAVVNAIADHVQSARALDARDFDSLAAVLERGFDEAVITMTESLEASVLAVLHCRRLGLPRIRAKALSDDHAAVLRAVGATDVIFPERETADRLAAQIQHPNLLDFIPVAPGFSVLDLAPPPEFAGQSLAQLGLRRRYGVLVIAVRRGPTGFQFLPGPDHQVQTGDVLVIIGRDTDLLKLEEAGGQIVRHAESPAAAPVLPPAALGPPGPIAMPAPASPAAASLAASLQQAAKAGRTSKRGAKKR